ncbi:cell division cycle protein 123 homolog, partial [Contarinia nasturtii]|uniref:cell division cycle protein 123 homolog n=1 Tax=Contarinia nasturtii TaxID=265458 RepID=UPI0012D41231
MQITNQEIKECVDLRACAYTNWYKKFRKITFESICIPLPKEIVQYLLDEIIILPKECYSNDDDNENAFGPDTAATAADNEDDDDDVIQPQFPEFSETLANALSRLDGSVFVKTNWNSPKDAFWITAGQTMCCKDIIDVYQLLKASGICKEDLSCHNLPIFDLEPLAEACSSSDTDSSDSSINQSMENSQYLIFKKWHDIHPGTEFRCFVQNKRLIGISPRDWPQYHEYICTQRVNIVNDIVSTFKEHIKPKFPLYDYVFDVVRDAKDRVFLLDFSPFNEKYTESLAFEWSD